MLGSEAENPRAHHTSGRRTAVLQYRPFALSCAVGGVFPVADYGIRLRALLTLNNVELDLVAFFERFVSIQLDC
jgi:hypothetical protein